MQTFNVDDFEFYSLSSDLARLELFGFRLPVSDYIDANLIEL